MTNDTIFAPATAAGRAGIAVIRISGPAAGQALRDLAGLASPAPRHATRCRLVDPGSGDTLDDGLALWFPAPASFTGEDVVELHVHGGRATVGVVCAALADRKEYRIAEPGEFTRRAFDNGKLDLTEVEGLADLVAAETEAQRKQALRQLDGALGRHCEGWRDQLLRTLALIEADIDFPEEGLPEDLATAIKHNIWELEDNLSQYLDDNRRGERIRDGVFIAILGAPNVGKSSLLNALAQRDAVIVSHTPGTTRDVVEVHLDLSGYAVTLADTAGLREAADHIEQEG
ncbi:MAG: tRNA uridine-5-carboxymethylaminomethyl(34) synthesis GTPase MnmE, partial [Rhodospirillaceae bacterium]|nr:tRNA uridine-5-carboxymethylaminomethyl(34) synthesis GTPase MnmE [Rhodospirillaceae bacterium]